MSELVLLVADLITLVVASALLMQGRFVVAPTRYRRIEARLVKVEGVSQNKGKMLYYPTYQVAMETQLLEVTSLVGTFRKEPPTNAWMLIHKKSQHASMLRDQRISFGLGVLLVALVVFMNVVR